VRPGLPGSGITQRRSAWGRLTLRVPDCQAGCHPGQLCQAAKPHPKLVRSHYPGGPAPLSRPIGQGRPAGAVSWTTRPQPGRFCGSSEPSGVFPLERPRSGPGSPRSRYEGSGLCDSPAQRCRHAARCEQGEGRATLHVDQPSRSMLSRTGEGSVAPAMPPAISASAITAPMSVAARPMAPCQSHRSATACRERSRAKDECQDRKDLLSGR
jgi:hypothetical protein